MALRVFAAVAGQRDNVGDSMLRRPLLRTTEGLGERHILVGPRSDQYVANLGVRPEDVIYTDRRKWLFNMAKSAAGSKIHLLLNAGEATIDLRYLVDRLVLLPVLLVIRMRRGSVIQTGIGLRNIEHRSSWVTRAMLRTASLVTWRDDQSRRAVGLGDVQPDWGLVEGQSSDVIAKRQRNSSARRLVLSIRGDRTPPSREWIGRIRTVLSTEGVSVAVVCQVRRDEPRLRWLAAELGAEYVGWDSDSDHAEQEAQVRAVYAGATWVVSDRLHALVAAVTEGCVVLPWLPDKGEKLARTLAAAGMTYEFAEPSREHLDGVVTAQADTLRAVESSRNQLARLAAAVRAAMGDASQVRQGSIRVLHSISAPTSDTRYSTHMAATSGDGVDVEFFTWRKALFGKYDLFHVHWPEHLVGLDASLSAYARYVLFRLLLLRLRRRCIAVVRTLHNVTPHDGKESPRIRRATSLLESRTVVEVHLVPEPHRLTQAATVMIPHGSYIEPFRAFESAEQVEGRLLYFGLLKKYKGVDSLLAAFGRLDDPDLSLRIVGKPVDPDTAASISSTVERDARISAKLDFVADRTLVREITSSELVVLPYRELHSSGAVLVALSLSRPVLVPDTTTSRSLREEVGPDWVHLFQPPLEPQALLHTLAATRLRPPSAAPDLSARDWGRVRAAHRRAYIEALKKVELTNRDRR